MIFLHIVRNRDLINGKTGLTQIFRQYIIILHIAILSLTHALAHTFLKIFPNLFAQKMPHPHMCAHTCTLKVWFGSLSQEQPRKVEKVILISCSFVCSFSSIIFYQIYLGTIGWCPISVLAPFILVLYDLGNTGVSMVLLLIFFNKLP